MLDDRVAFREHGSKIELTARNDLPYTRNGLREIQHLDRAKQRFTRVAPPVVTLPADQAILDERYRKARRRQLPNGSYSAHPAAYDDHVEVCAKFHLPSPSLIGTYGRVLVQLNHSQRPSSRHVVK
jgi:hypothetical protein